MRLKIGLLRMTILWNLVEATGSTDGNQSCTDVDLQHPLRWKSLSILSPIRLPAKRRAIYLTDFSAKRNISTILPARYVLHHHTRVTTQRLCGYALLISLYLRTRGRLDSICLCLPTLLSPEPCLSRRPLINYHTAR
jgi:hypothetical protein